ncbi:MULTISPECIES: LPXTG cell wall anchor domain-containing protein [unclassified Actinotalea]|uniref:LPXTG cell wall anchor domain-containing protein n=1 Tax=unclassified Actinotalea TaxID=2638618 RepID=UPI0015F3E65A|nr:MULTISPECIES: LPXTG cell wall anchor domain-containing protein [unclassified Actinotalea]
MKRALRFVAALAIAVGGGVGAAGAASATTVTDCAPGATSYSPGGVCDVSVVTEVMCNSGVPTLQYAITARGTSATTATLTWVNPTGEDVVVTGLPLEGSVTWPGAQAGTVGTTAAWARGPVEAQFHVNPTTVATVSYPTSTACVQGVTAASNRLAATGSSTTPLLAGAGGLVAAGVVGVLVARRRRTGSLLEG